jgi:hypothetical protein
LGSQYGIYHLLTDREDRVEGRQRILRDHRDLKASQMVLIFPRHLEDVTPFKPDASTDDPRLGCHHVQDGPSRDRFAGAALSNESDDLVVVNPKAHAIYRMNYPPPSAKLNPQVLDCEQRFRLARKHSLSSPPGI